MERRVGERERGMCLLLPRLGSKSLTHSHGIPNPITLRHLEVAHPVISLFQKSNKK